MRFIWISDLNYKIRFWKMKKTAIIIRWVAAYIADMLPEYGFKLKIHLKKIRNNKLFNLLILSFLIVFCLKNELFSHISSTSMLLLCHWWRMNHFHYSFLGWNFQFLLFWVSSEAANNFVFIFLISFAFIILLSICNFWHFNIVFYQFIL